MDYIDDPSKSNDVHSLIKTILDELITTQQSQAEPAYKKELSEERTKRESLEKKLNELIEENKRAKAAADSLERESKIKTELQRQGVIKVDLAYKAVKDDVHREQDGSLIAKSADGPLPIKEFLKKFLDENPELLPARNLTGSGSTNTLNRNQSFRALIWIQSIQE